MAWWNPHVLMVPDSANNGRPTAALSGRVHLFSREANSPIAANGQLVVSVFEVEPGAGTDTKSVPLETWKITSDCMKLSIAKDIVGWGYSVTLPWNTYRPDIEKVELEVKYLPPKDALEAMPLRSKCVITLITKSDQKDTPQP
jgi:hypothetical protein